MCSTTGAVAAITATIAMYFTTEAGAAATAREVQHHGLHAYLAPLLTDECRSTLGPQGGSHKKKSVMTSLPQQRSMLAAAPGGDFQGGRLFPP